MGSRARANENGFIFLLYFIIHGKLSAINDFSVWLRPGFYPLDTAIGFEAILEKYLSQPVRLLINC